MTCLPLCIALSLVSAPAAMAADTPAPTVTATGSCVRYFAPTKLTVRMRLFVQAKNHAGAAEKISAAQAELSKRIEKFKSKPQVTFETPRHIAAAGAGGGMAQRMMMMMQNQQPKKQDDLRRHAVVVNLEWPLGAEKAERLATVDQADKEIKSLDLSVIVADEEGNVADDDDDEEENDGAKLRADIPPTAFFSCDVPADQHEQMTQAAAKEATAELERLCRAAGMAKLGPMISITSKAPASETESMMQAQLEMYMGDGAGAAFGDEKDAKEGHIVGSALAPIRFAVQVTITRGMIQ